MEERIDVISETGEFTGRTALKSDIHTKGYYHNTAHVWLYTQNGEILLQQRAREKEIYPLLWDVSVAGHVDAGEAINVAAIREAKEEIGINLETSQLEKIGVDECFRSYPNGLLDNEFHHVFIAELKVGLHGLVPQPKEVEALKLVSFGEFLGLLKNSDTNGHFVASNRDYYRFVVKMIQNKLNLN